MNQDKLTKEQVEHWRKMLYIIVGPYAGFMTSEQIQEYRDMMQKQVNNIK